MLFLRPEKKLENDGPLPSALLPPSHVVEDACWTDKSVLLVENYLKNLNFFKTWKFLTFAKPQNDEKRNNFIE